MQVKGIIYREGEPKSRFKRLTNEIHGNTSTIKQTLYSHGIGHTALYPFPNHCYLYHFSYLSKSKIMVKLELRPSEPSEDNDAVNASLAGLYNTKTTASKTLSNFGNLGSTVRHNHIRNGLIPFYDRLINKMSDKYSLDDKPISVRKPLKLESWVTKAPIPIPLAGAIYKPGHLDNDIDIERLCPREGDSTKLLVLITSAIHHRAARMAIRQTWMHYGSRRDVGMAFVLGHGKDNKQNKALDSEDFMYRDLIRGNFVDSYNNLTLKTMSLLEWVHHHCRRAKYILKTDDDMFVNIPKLLSFLDTHKANRTIYGRRADFWKPVRNKWSKYYISSDQYVENVFPTFTTGPAYILTGDIVGELLVCSLSTPFLKLEDVFITGIVAESLAIKRVNVREIANVRIVLEACRIRDKITVHMVSPNEQFDVWMKLLDNSIKCYKGKRSN
ncbi:beta-1,3-galactosyltransferase 5 isoform X2 [Drosophila serrata]|uniref:beta-1,3-galactosyltransferase 5 isoform X2 n=1 Tax=Drosophila serrata TaxID=7274 RepID=UPI000A1CF4C7|nr:beta-1,3-galactosyltransferase 5 isoform X2 [Drosophila serrata]